MTTTIVPMIYGQITKITDGINPVKKDKQNKQGWLFRGIDDFMNALNPLFAKHGVIPIMTVLKTTRDIKTSKNGTLVTTTLLDVKTTFYAEDGSSIDVVTIGEAMDYGDKSANKAQSYAYKVAMMFTFCIPTEDLKDGDGETFMLKGDGVDESKNNFNQQNNNQKTDPVKTPEPDRASNATQEHFDDFMSKIQPFNLMAEDKEFIKRITAAGCMYGELTEAFEKIKKQPKAESGNLNNGNS